MTKEEVTTLIKERKINDIPFELVTAVASNPTMYGLTFGDFTYVANHACTIAYCIQKAHNAEIDPEQMVTREEFDKLNNRVRELEDRLQALREALAWRID